MSPSVAMSSACAQRSRCIKVDGYRPVVVGRNRSRRHALQLCLSSLTTSRLSIPYNPRKTQMSIYGPDMNFARAEDPIEMSWMAMPGWEQPEHWADLDGEAQGRLEEHSREFQPAAPEGAPEGASEEAAEEDSRKRPRRKRRKSP